MREHEGALATAGRSVLQGQPFSVLLGAQLGEDVVTAELKINYLRPAKGCELVAHAVTLYAGHNQAVCRCDVFERDDRGASRLCATAQGTVWRMAATRSQLSSNHT